MIVLHKEIQAGACQGNWQKSTKPSCVGKRMGIFPVERMTTRGKNVRLESMRLAS
jgi:hypothetical protein